MPSRKLWRNSQLLLSLESVKAQTVVLSGIRAAGDTHFVLISANLLNSVDMAHSRKVADDSKEKAVKNKKAEEAAAGKLAAKKTKDEQQDKYFTEQSIIVYIDRFYD